MTEESKEPEGVVGEQPRRPWTRHLLVFFRNAPIYGAGAVVLHFLTRQPWFAVLMVAAAFAVSEPYFQYRRDLRARRRAGEVGS